MSTATKSKPTFTEWLSRQVERDDPVGDVAGDVKRDRCWPVAVDSLDAVLSHLRRHMACDDAIRATKAAWRRYQESITPKGPAP